MTGYATNVVRALQSRLKELGYYGGEVDGVPGPMTSAATTAFKQAHGFRARDYVGPLTLALLFSNGAKANSSAPASVGGAPEWYDELLARRGLHERTDNAELRAWLRSDGATLGDPAKLPWCGDAVETAIRLALPNEPIPENPYLARNWLKFGIEVPLVKGAVCVFWRGSRDGTSGHVGLVAGEDATTVHVLGGNQLDGVTIRPLSKSRLLGCRWPVTAPPPANVQLASVATGALSTNEA